MVVSGEPAVTAGPIRVPRHPTGLDKWVVRVSIVMHISLVLFTRDLRVHDNPALCAAADEADRVIPLFVVDSRLVASGYPGGNRAAFLARCLADLNAGLRERGGRLVIRTGDPARCVRGFVGEYGIRGVHIADDVSGHAQRRLRRLRAALDGTGARLHTHPESITAVAPARLSPSGRKDHFAVFTPVPASVAGDAPPAGAGTAGPGAPARSPLPR